MRHKSILRALMERTSLRTIPQVFVAGKLFGGSTEVLDAFNDGSLRRP